MGPSIAILLVDASERLLGDALARLAEAGFPRVTVSHAFAVQSIGSGIVTITALSAAMRMTPQAVSAIINHLVERGFVIRGPLAGDRRAKGLTLTDDGRRLALAIDAVLQAVEREWVSLVGADRYGDMTAALEAYVADRASGPESVRSRRIRIS